LNAALFRIANSILPNLREYVVKLSRANLPARVSLPPDFISFADEQAAYLNGQPFTLTKFIGDRDVILTGNETLDTSAEICEYHLFYNADYPRLSDTALTWTVVNFVTNINTDSFVVETVSVNAYHVPDVAAMAVPHYIAGHLLSLDDKVRSIEELSEFEILLSVMSTSRHERTREFHSSRGWY
jgi:hypothetical protein